MSDKADNKPVESSKFMVGILQNLDLASIATDVLKYSMDEKESSNQLTLLLDETQNNLKTAQEFDALMLNDGYNILKLASNNLLQATNIIYQWQRLGGLAAKAGSNVGAQLFGNRIQNIAAKTHADFWSRILFDMPESIGAAKVQKWYNKAFPHEEPSEGDMYLMVANGFKTPLDVINKYREDMSFTETDAINLAQIRNWQIGVPSLRDAWTLVQRGLWLKSDWLKLATLGQGFTIEDANAIYQLYNYVPSIGDVMSLSDLIPLESVWVNAAFDRAGMNATDKALFLSAMNKKIIKMEIRGFWSAIVQSYAYGGYTEAELRALLTSWQFTQAEIEIKVSTCELTKTKTVNTLMRDADIYLYRAGTIPASGATALEGGGLYERLIAQDIPIDVANAITRNEACKKGIDWELPY